MYNDISRVGLHIKKSMSYTRNVNWYPCLEYNKNIMYQIFVNEIPSDCAQGT